MTSTLPDPRTATGPTIHPAQGDRGTRVAFVASLAVGLASAGWEPQQAGSELLAAADDDVRVLDAASARLLDRWVVDPRTVVRAGRLLHEARRLAGSPQDDSASRRPALQLGEVTA